MNRDNVIKGILIQENINKDKDNYENLYGDKSQKYTEFKNTGKSRIKFPKLNKR